MASLLLLVRPWLDHFSAGRWSHSQTACIAKCTAASDMAHSAACSSSASQSSHIGLLGRLPTRPCLFRFRNDCLERRTLFTGLFSQVGLLLGQGRTTTKPPTLFYVTCAQKLRFFMFRCVLIPHVPASFTAAVCLL